MRNDNAFVKQKAIQIMTVEPFLHLYYKVGVFPSQRIRSRKLLQDQSHIVVIGKDLHDLLSFSDIVHRTGVYKVPFSQYRKMGTDFLHLIEQMAGKNDRLSIGGDIFYYVTDFRNSHGGPPVPRTSEDENDRNGHHG